MQMLIELIAGFVALLAAAALAQFGVELNSPRQADREVHRVSDCPEKTATASFAAAPAQDC